ncbi:uncharacterized protein Smp_200320 [Schistosoma mansoni]|uniref:uncharacterized protein n=1 Tax=Schistosoma mansoni TaxID=6183 RepID=UPI00022DC965|nr:uncharacterized protein Smp_200320 [Schistosoma mansoni]|eukprot:XP_018647673.1 uncharacterized protein Smp_200320 [Schistosoma mansoni]
MTNSNQNVDCLNIIRGLILLPIYVCTQVLLLAFALSCSAIIQFDYKFAYVICSLILTLVLVALWTVLFDNKL